MRNRYLITLLLSFTAVIFNGCNEDDDDVDADFSSSSSTIDVGQSINFTDESLGNPTSWEWTFEGGAPETSTDQNPNGVGYASAGTYDVSLTVTNENGSDTETKTGYVVVNQVGGCNGGTTVTDIDGNTYDVVQIGSQCWMAENLKTTHYRDGSLIPVVTDNTAWGNLVSGAYCHYDNDNAHDNTYGKLYNWYAVMDTRGLCPEG
ncbi:MAG: FISUMP domain-containing protein, partial [Flavobacteriales bacterium]|nr:FISUMP domain-containing protein [Flavobacteriales bacterium]